MTLDEPILIDASNIDMSNTVFMTLSNPFYDGEEINNMEVSYEYPEDRLHIIQIVKLAVRCGLNLGFYSKNKKAMEWLSEYYDYYKS